MQKVWTLIRTPTAIKTNTRVEISTLKLPLRISIKIKLILTRRKMRIRLKGRCRNKKLYLQFKILQTSLNSTKAMKRRIKLKVRQKERLEITNR